jgi:hypothetical protein
MQQNKNWIWIFLGVIVFSVFSLGLLMLVFSGQFRTTSKQFVSQVIQQVPFLPDPRWSQGGEEKIIPVVIKNEHPQMKMSQSEFISFDFITDRFQNYFSKAKIERVVIHLTDEPQFINESIVVNDAQLQIVGFGADEIDNQAHIYLFANSENLLESNLSIDEIVEKIEWNLTGGLVFLRSLVTRSNYSGEKYFMETPENIFEETRVEQKLINLSKNNQPLVVVSIKND